MKDGVWGNVANNSQGSLYDLAGFGFINHRVTFHFTLGCHKPVFQTIDEVISQGATPRHVKA
jgi:hypothetical protein